MRKSRMVLAMASAFPLALTFTFTGAVPAFAQAADSTNAPVKELGMVTITGGQPTSLPTQIPTTIEGVTREQISRYFTTDVRVRYQITKQVSAAVGIDNLNNYPFWNFHPYPQRTYLAELKVNL